MTTVQAGTRTKVLQRQGAAVALVLMVAVSWLVFPRFGSLDNLRDLALQGSFLAVIALGMTFVIITGGIDLSVGSLYALGGVLAAVSGVLATSRLGASDPADMGLLMELSAITAVVVGGTPLTGGKVRVLGTVMGVVLMQLVRATLIKHDLPDSIAQMIQAAIIVAAVYVARERR